jgi:hypothetical protein
LADQRRYLAWWSDRFRGSDLRRVTLRDHIFPALDGVGGRAPRIAVIKRLYAWLRERDVITPAEDPTYGRLKVPQAKPAQWERSKVIPRADYEKARLHIEPEVYRDALDVLAGTGWHTTELNRFAAAGGFERYRGDDPGGSVVLVCPRHKIGGEHRTNRYLPRMAFASGRSEAQAAGWELIQRREPFDRTVTAKSEYFQEAERELRERNWPNEVKARAEADLRQWQERCPRS